MEGQMERRVCLLKLTQINHVIFVGLLNHREFYILHYQQKLLNSDISSDPKWAEISDSQKKELDFSNEDDGEFWMEYDDVVANFDNVTICRIINTDVSLIRKRVSVSCVN